MVFIMPGMENLAPERTLTSSGSEASPSFLPIFVFEVRERMRDLFADLFRDAVLVLKIDVADFGGDGEAGRNGNARAAHLGQASAFSAENVLHFAIAIGGAAAKCVNVFFHDCLSVTISEKSATSENSVRRFWSSASRLRRSSESGALTSTLSKKRSTLGRSGPMRDSSGRSLVRDISSWSVELGARFEQSSRYEPPSENARLLQDVLDALETGGDGFEIGRRADGLDAS